MILREILKIPSKLNKFLRKLIDIWGVLSKVFHIEQNVQESIEVFAILRKMCDILSRMGQMFMISGKLFEILSKILVILSNLSIMIFRKIIEVFKQIE